MQATPESRRAGAATARSDTSLERWEQLAQGAQQHFHAGQVESALALLMKALHVAQRLICGPQLAQEPDRCLAAWVVSHHNLADLLALRSQHALAIDYLCEAHQGLLALGDARIHTAAVHSAAWRHLRETHGALLQWQRQHGSQAHIDATLQASARVFGSEPDPARAYPH
jgi:hypothetical protein